MKPTTPTCLRCGAPMQRTYIHTQDPETKKRSYDGVGWLCSNPGCNFFTHD